MVFFWHNFVVHYPGFCKIKKFMDADFPIILLCPNCFTVLKAISHNFFAQR